MVWDVVRIAELKRLWQLGLSCNQIATALGGVTRNGVIGKIYRLGLSERLQNPRAGQPDRRPRRKRSAEFVHQGTARKMQSQTNRRAAAAAPNVVDTYTTPEADLQIPLKQRIYAITKLTDLRCRWPVGDVQDRENFFFCGGPALPGKVYCCDHCGRAYNPVRSAPAVSQAKIAAWHRSTWRSV
jgi:GcrA cell cycle regulator